MDDLLTTHQLEQLLQVDRITIYRMLGDGRLRGLKVGGQWRFPRAEVEAWLRGQQSFTDAGLEETTGERSNIEALPLSCIQAIQAVFAQARGVAAVTTDPDGSPLTEVSNGCAFCESVRATEEGRARCVESWRTAAGTPRSCHAGLLCAAAAVRIEGRTVAKAVACQFLGDVPAEPEPGEDRPRPAPAPVHLIPENDLPKMEPLLRSVAHTYAEIGRERLKLLSRLQRIAKITALKD